MDDELRWIEEARAGSLEAFSKLVLLHQGRLRGYVGRHVRETDAADDFGDGDADLLRRGRHSRDGLREGGDPGD
ncbi:MAG: hypothetical protein HY293_07130 [Planctomycetes bacterium]|nr:hypothetical protein [Planctomycetota bacterium]